MTQRTEQEIMKNWKYMEPPLVSVCCITYNHESYIRDAVEGFLMQETDFPFEVIIHDDASTDNTAQIVREYAERYPQIIKPIYQTENQVSKGVRISSTFVWPKARGEYIALCEGDDYWTDARKLQIQIEEMAKHPECDMSFHPAVMIDVGTNKEASLGFHGDDKKIVSGKEVIRGGAAFVPTASILIKRETINDMPILGGNSSLGSYLVKICGSINAGSLYLNKFMSVYRYMAVGSWNERMGNDLDKQIAHILSTEQYFLFLKSRLPSQFNADIDYVISIRKLGLAKKALINRRYGLFQSCINDSHHAYHRLNNTQRLLYFSRYLPSMIMLAYAIKKTFKIFIKKL